MDQHTQQAASGTGQVTTAGDALYDSIMAEIEPELTTAQINTLVEKYKGETPEEAKARAERYNKAFEEYEKRFAQTQQGWDASFKQYKHEALASAEKEDRTEDEKNLTQLEASLKSL